MADIKAGEPFGLDSALVDKMDWSLAAKRVVHDIRTDFIYAPHLRLIHNNAEQELANLVKAELKAGKFSPGLPVTIEVPKSFRIRISGRSKRLGPNFSRPGSILLPKDRLFYQALADQAVHIVEAKTDKTRSFSHRLAALKSESMFLPTRTCRNNFQKALSKHAKEKDVHYIMEVDVANFFGSLNQHTLINVLHDAGYPKALGSRLEAILTSFTGERSSRGILQGLYPSDLFGNFYLAPIDRFLSDAGILSARYVDDLYMFVGSVDAADHALRGLIPELRAYDLVLNEAKSVIMPKSALVSEEPDLEQLFSDAVKEIADQVDDEGFDADYGFQTDWEEDEEPEDEDLKFQATILLFDSIGDYPGNEEQIERFCLPLFLKAGSSYAVQHVIDSFKKRPSMAQIYSGYLARFIDDDESIRTFLETLLGDEALLDWQKMWVIAALSQLQKAADASVRPVFGILKDPTRHDALRAAAAIFVGRFGDHARRKALIGMYGNVSDYVKIAIYYSTRGWPNVERSNAKASWGNHSPMHALLTTAMAKKQ